jgi:hypothetical protein
MILLDYPYVSDFLLDTISKFELPVIATKNALELASGRKMRWISESEALEILQKDPHHPVYTNSENSVQWIKEHLPNSSLYDTVHVFKNKFEFRRLVADAYPEIFFQAVALEQLDQIEPKNLVFPLIMKPSVGFFSLGIQRIDRASDWKTAVVNLKSDISTFKSLYPTAVVDSSQILLESYIEGDEYAFDCYFNKDGNPVLLNILHHTFSSADDVSDRLYSSCPSLITQMYKPIMDFLEMLGSKISLRNVPLHIEIRKKGGKIYPIEVNPLRFGGFCTTADLTWYAYGINSYLSFLQGIQPDWEHILPPRTDKIFSLILLDNQANIDPQEFDHFDYEALLGDFEKPLHLRKVPFDKFGVFGFLFTETRMKNKKELDAILYSDLRKYIKLRSRPH